jgi:hypothetical protein
MERIVFKSASKKKMGLLVRVAKEMGIETEVDIELTDEEMALPGPKPTTKQLEAWLAKDDGEGYGIEEAFSFMKKELAKGRKK